MIRRIHLDFHTHPAVRDVGAGFEPERFADTLARAGVNMLTTPGKCHFGHHYFDAHVGPAHPNLVRPDVFPETVRACTARGIRVQAYFTLGLDGHAAPRHPEWRQRFADGRYSAWSEGFEHMCFASDYVEQAVVPEVLETIERCPGICGFWFDISIHVFGAYYSDAFNQLAADRLGDQSDCEDARWHLARQIVYERCQLIDREIQKRLPGAENFFNSLVGAGEHERLSIQPVPEFEHPFLFQGSEKLTTYARLLRWRGKPVVGLTSRFQNPWGDPGTLRTPDQMRFDVGRTLALGCHPSMGDHRQPDGMLQEQVYDQLGPIFQEAASAEPWLSNNEAAREAVLIGGVEKGAASRTNLPRLSEQTVQAARLLEQHNVQFDVVTGTERPPSAPLWIWCGEGPVTADTLECIRSHLDAGGALLGMGGAIEYDLPWGAALESWSAGGTSDAKSSDDAADGAGHEATPAHGEIGPAGDFAVADAALGLKGPPLVLRQPARLIRAQEDATVLADRYEPTGPKPGFASGRKRGPAIVQQGHVIYSTADLVREQAGNGADMYAQWFYALVDRLLGGRLITHDAGGTVAAHLHRAPHGSVVHLVHWAMDRWGVKPNPAGAFPRLAPFEVLVRVDRPVQRVMVLPAEEPIDFEQDERTCRIMVPGLHVWSMIAIEH